MSDPAISQSLQNVDIGGGVEKSSFPAATKHAAGLVNGKQTDVSSIYFSDKILITISQEGRLSQWVCFSIPLRILLIQYYVDSSSALLSFANLIRYRFAFRYRGYASTWAFDAEDSAWCWWRATRNNWPSICKPDREFDRYKEPRGYENCCGWIWTAKGRYREGGIL